ncbi:adenine deaminase [Limoniibacter endophyticus]|uniref:Adenine deaminase n=1 Tax=Limoniibacter endophyticus TaxID=1565040 RepID=A0A8J3DJB9_9HYPH|nr:adenine deaminase C-terminal domain-containing protein [Limoniibacter endophyticus]GHC73151.1 adenine deaminase 2 [Limoniibacter endophyticus]
MSKRFSEPDDLASPTLRRRAVAAARGEADFDLLITGGTLVDMVTGELRKADIGIVDALIASVHEHGAFSRAKSVMRVDGQFITPGLIDTHMHIESSMVTPETYARAVLPRGVTTICWDPHEFGNVHGLNGVRWALDAVADLPLRVVTLAPSCVPSAPGLERAGADFGPREMAEMLSWPGIGGIAEVMNMQGVIEADPRMSGIIDAGLASGKLVCGHARSLTGSRLNAFMAAGITSDHELTSAADLLEKLRAGMAIELRGSHDHLLPEFVDVLNKLPHLPQTLTLCTDDVFPDDLLNAGGLDDVVRRLVRYGLMPEWALRAATLNAARRLKRDDLGLIASGRRADIAIFADFSEFQCTYTIVNGQLVARDGRMLQALAGHDCSPLHGSVQVPPLEADDFKVRVENDRAQVEVAIIDRPRFTQWASALTKAEDGFVIPPPGTTMISVTHRHGQAEARPKTGYLGQWGDWKGAFCTTVAHDSHNLTVFGGNEADMALAANAVIEMGGGMAVAQGGKILARLPLPVSGLVSEAPLDTVAEEFSNIRTAMNQVVDWQPPYLVFKACFGATLACNAGPHQTDIGIADVASGKVLETPVLN